MHRTADTSEGTPCQGRAATGLLQPVKNEFDEIRVASGGALASAGRTIYALNAHVQSSRGACRLKVSGLSFDLEIRNFAPYFQQKDYEA
jgi:hypothetical protein